jgi:hypothetical protein
LIESNHQWEKANEWYHNILIPEPRVPFGSYCLRVVTNQKVARCNETYRP